MLFRRRTAEETNQELANKESRGGFVNGLKRDYSSYQEKQLQRANARKEYRKGLVKAKDVEKDFTAFGKGARAGLSGGTLFGRMTRRR